MRRALQLLILGAFLAAISGCATFDRPQTTAFQTSATADDLASAWAIATPDVAPPAPIAQPIQVASIDDDTIWFEMANILRSESRLPWERSQAPPLLAQNSTFHLGADSVPCIPQPRPARGGFSSRPLAPAGSFCAQLQTTLVPERSIGSGTPTFSRALAAYATDFEGRLVSVPANAARMQGTRIVQNLVFPNTENLTAAAGWVVVGGATVTQGQTDPLGGTGATKIVTGGVGASGINNNGVMSATNRTYVRSVWLRGEVGGETVRFGDDTNKSTVTVTTTWQRYSASAIQASTYFDLYSANATVATFYVWRPQAEDVTGQTNQNPSEYVSVGVLSAPYHGLGVDGIKAFDTLNGNTVASNVVTEATGAHIDSSQAAAAGGVTAGVVDATGPLGYLAEGSAQNVLTYSQTLSNAAWTKTNVSLGTATTGPDGTASAIPVIEDNTTNNHLLQHGSFTAVNGTTYTGYTIVKNVDRRYIILDLSDGLTGGVYAYFDLQTGVISQAVTNGGSWTNGVAAIYPMAWGGYLCVVTGTLGANNTINLLVSLSNAATGGETVSYLGDGAKSILHWQSQLVVGTIASSPVVTTTAVTRPADVLTYASAGNINASAGTFYAEFTNTGVNAGQGATLIGSAGSGVIPVYFNGATFKADVYDGTNDVGFGAVGTPTTPSQVAAYWSGAAMGGSRDGSAVTSGTFTGSMTVTAIAIGSADSGIHNLNGTIRNVRIWPVALTPGRLTTMTANAQYIQRIYAEGRTIDLQDSRWLTAAANDDWFRMAANQ